MKTIALVVLSLIQALQPGSRAAEPPSSAIVVDISGNIYAVDVLNSRILKFSAEGARSIFAGAQGGFRGDGGPAASAQFRLLESPAGLLLKGGLARDRSGNIYVAD